MVAALQFFDSTNAEVLWTVIKEKRLLIVNLTFILMLYLNDEFVTQKQQICYISQ